ncbi:MAG TPA: hypothetical protein VKP65_02880 [Rhodothermales bacterium]|nr:hypothetical protein [Rhodothermales bacterium]
MILPEIQHYEEVTGVDSGFFERLLEEDDWSFIIKLHAFIEAVATQAIVRHLREPDLADYFARIDLSGQQTGKVRILSEIGLIGKPIRRFISSLSQLRNSLVHDVRNVSYDLQASVNSMSSKELRRFSQDFSCLRFIKYETSTDSISLIPHFEIDEAELNKLVEQPRLFILLGALSLLNSLYDMGGYSDYKQYEKAMRVLKNKD